MTEKERPAGIPPASVTGRAGKLAVGVIQIWYAIECIRYFETFSRPSLRSGIWLFVALGLWLFPFAVQLGYRQIRRLGRRPLWLVLGVAGLLALWDWVRTGEAWGPAVGAWLLAVAVYAHLHVGVSHFLAAVSGLPGCEMRVIPYYLSRWRGGPAAAHLHLCPGFWTPIDRWEAARRRKGA